MVVGGAEHRQTHLAGHALDVGAILRRVVAVVALDAEESRLRHVGDDGLGQNALTLASTGVGQDRHSPGLPHAAHGLDRVGRPVVHVVGARRVQGLNEGSATIGEGTGGDKRIGDVRAPHGAALGREGEHVVQRDRVVGGQVLDLEGEGRRLDLAALRKIHMGKTGALFCAAIRSGAILAGAKEEELAALTLYAERFGLAFQITDDILDVTGDEAAIGKPVGSDVRNEKATYVTLTSLEEAKKLAEDAVDEAVAALDIFGERAAFLRDLALFLLGRKK